MKNFNLYVLRQNLNNRHNPSLIPIGASHQSTTSYPQGTYNEKLTNKPNSQAQLTFNISTMCNGRHNRNADLMVNGQRLRLVFENNKKTCQDFFITKVAPAVTQDNSILTITAVDWFSYFLSHTAIGLNYDTLDYGGVKTIQELAGDILRVSKVTNWKVDQELINSKLPRFYEKQNTVQPMKISFSVSGSNCYNAIVEIAKKFDATIVPSYDWSGYGGSIDFINNNDFESNIYHLSPTVNINTFGTNQQSNNLCTVMYVKGATDAHGKDVTLTPTMHGAFKYWLLEHMCYDDAKKPTCLEHNYPILITKSFNESTLQYTYKKYRNSLYSSGKSSLYRELNKEKDKYIGLYKKYDSREQIVFTAQIGSSSEWTLKVGGTPITIDNPKIVHMDDRTKALEIRLDPALITNSGEVTIQFSTTTGTKTDLWPVAKITITNSTWTVDEDTNNLNIDDIWEAQDTMTDVYQLFNRDWRACTQTNDAGLYSFKSLDIGDMVPGIVYNYCKYIDEQVPSAGNFLYSFDYLLEQRLITPVEYYGLNFAFSRELRNLNLKIAIYAELYYELKYQFNSRLATIKTYLSTFLAEIDVHRESINGKKAGEQGSTYPSMLTPTPDVVTNLIKRHASDSDLIPMNSTAFTSKSIGTGVPYYTTICKNKLLEITSSILREGLTSDFVRNCVILYGSNFFADIGSWISSDPNFKIFQDETDSFFSNLYNYDLILGRTGTQGQFKEITDNDPIHDVGRSIEADTYLAQAELVRKQASYWYDDANTIYRNEPTGLVPGTTTDERYTLNVNYFYHPNYREVFLNLIQEFIVSPQSPYYSYIQQASAFNLVQFYEDLLQEKDELWADICERYGNFILEGTYNDSVELTTAGLYNAALLNFTKANRPIYNYSVTSIDASQLMSTGTEDIQVGDRISIHHPAVFPKPNYNKTIIHIINDKNDATLSYRIPPKGSQITSTSFERYHLVETDENVSDIFDQILGSDYGTNIGKILDSDATNHDITVEWNNEWSMFAIDSLNTLNYGTTLFCGNYQGVTDIKKFEDGDENTTYKAGEWIFSQTDVISETGRGYKVYQVVKDFIRSTWDKALDCIYQIDVYYGYTDLANLHNGELYIDDSKKFYQKYSELEYNVDGTPKLDAKGQQIITHKGKEVISYPVYADFVYEPEELLLTITGVTVTLRESKTQLQVQDNSLINSLVDKLLYSVRFN